MLKDCSLQFAYASAMGGVAEVVEVGQFVLRQRDGRWLRLVNQLGQGGEGTVFLAYPEQAKQTPIQPLEPLAVKWYHTPQLGASRHERIAALTQMRPPSDRFLWPDSLVSSPVDSQRLGYSMPLRPAGFVGFDQVVAQPDPLPFAIAATMARNLADTFHSLHSAGFSYRDIKDANIFVRPTDGEVLVCDNDNVALEGAPAGVRGSLYFMAPEVMRGDAPPSRRSDQFSLAVLLAYLLLHHHPLEGSRTLRGSWDGDAQMEALARRPLFIFDQLDRSNAPDPDLQPLPLVWWALLPGYIQSLFTRTFGPGLVDPGARVTETEWRDALDDLRGSIVTCGCGASNLADPEGVGQACWRCRGRLPEVFILSPGRPRGRRPLSLDVGATLTSVNTNPALATDHRRIVGAVEGHPKEPTVTGLRNLGDLAWAFQGNGEASVLPVAPGQVLRIRPGTLSFGTGHSAFVTKRA